MALWAVDDIQRRESSILMMHLMDGSIIFNDVDLHFGRCIIQLKVEGSQAQLCVCVLCVRACILDDACPFRSGIIVICCILLKVVQLNSRVISLIFKKYKRESLILRNFS